MKRQALRFTPRAWAKLLYLRDAGPTEIGGFGITTSDDLLTIEDVRLVTQVCTSTHVEFDDAAVADFFDEQVDVGRSPESFARIWVHTHPGNSAEPSHMDEETFSRVFGSCEWAVMFILARGGATFARLRCNVGPRASVRLPVEVDFTRPFAASEHAQWQREYESQVLELSVEPPAKGFSPLVPVSHRADDAWYEAWDDYVQEFQSTQETIHVDDDDF
jgi:hypothetical protein